MAQQIVLPIKDSNILKMVQDTLLDSFRAGRRNYTIFQVGKATFGEYSRIKEFCERKGSRMWTSDNESY